MISDPSTPYRLYLYDTPPLGGEDEVAKDKPHKPEVDVNCSSIGEAIKLWRIHGSGLFGHLDHIFDHKPVHFFRRGRHSASC